MTAPSVHVLTDEGIPVGWSVIADYPALRYLADPDASRPATPAEMAALVEQAYAEYEAFRLVPPPSRVPHGPWPHSKAVAVAPEPAPGAVRCDCQDDPEPSPQAAERVASDDTAARFLALHAAGDEREATKAIPAVEAITATTPAITEGSAS